MAAATEAQWIGESAEAAEVCGYRILTVRDAVRNVIERRWDIPQFQRAFSWSPLQVRDLADSLWRGYPMGLLLLWRAPGAEGAPLMIAGGQHRLTALCMLFGQQPAWWSGERDEAWRDLMSGYDVRFEIASRAACPFSVGATRGLRAEAPAAPRVSSLLALDPAGAEGRQQLQRIARQACRDAPGYRVDEAYACLQRLCRIADRPLVAAIAERPLDDMLEIFVRLSGHGIRFRRLLLRTALRAVKGLWVSQTMR